MSNLDSKVDKTTKINGKPLRSNINLTKYDIGLSNVDNVSLTNSLNRVNSNIAVINNSIDLLSQSLDQKVDKSTTINGQSLASNVNINLLDQNTLTGKESLSNKNVPNGYAGLDSNGRVPANRIAISGLTYAGIWNAATNTPSLSTVSTSGTYYIVTVPGNTLLTGGINTWRLNDWVISNGSQWLRIVNSESVTSVNSKFGDVILNKNDISLSNVDNTSDINKPVSIALQTALDNKVNITTTINGYPLSSNVTLAKADIGLANVDNTSDINKPISTPQQTALDLKQSLADKNLPNGYAGLDSSGKLYFNQMPITGLAYSGTWNAATNTPTLSSGTGSAGNYYVVTVAGSTLLDTINTWHVNDWAIFNGTVWEKIDNYNLVVSVNGYTGAVVLTKADVGLANVDNTSDASKPLSTAVITALSLKQDLSQKGAPNGYASLDSSSKLTSSQLPSIAISSLSDVSITTPLDTQVLTYDSTLSKWKNATATSGSGGSLGTTGSGDSYVSSNFGVGTSTVNATLDVSPSLTTATTTGITTYGVSSCTVDGFGYPKILSVKGTTATVQPHTIVVNGTTYNIATRTFTNLTAPLYYIYSDGTTLLPQLSYLPYDSKSMSYQRCYPAMYQNFENDLYDPFGSPWFTNVGSTMVLDSSVYKFGSRSMNLTGTRLISGIVSKQATDTLPTLYLPYFGSWAVTMWVYMRAYPGGINNLIQYCIDTTSTWGFSIAINQTGNLLLWFSTDGGPSWTINGASLGGAAIPLNTWTQVGLAFSQVNGQILLKASTGYTNTSLSRGLVNGLTGNKFFLCINDPGGSPMQMNVDEIIVTPYYRDPSVIATSAFDTSAINMSSGTPFASYLNGSSSLVDGYDQMRWYGSYLTGPNFPGSNPSMQFTFTRSVYSPICPNLNLLPEWTIEFWFQVVTGSLVYFVDMRNAQSDNSICFQTSSNTQMSIWLSTNGTSWDLINGALITFPGLNSINYFVATYSATRGGYKFYLNSSLVLSNSSTTAVAPTAMVSLGPSVSYYQPSNPFLLNINDFRITPYLVYGTSGPTSNPTTLLGINTSRDLLDDVTTGTCTVQGLNPTTLAPHVYLGTVRTDLQTVRHWIPPMTSSMPLCKFNNYKLYYDGQVMSPKLSFDLPANTYANPRGYLALLRQDGRIFIGGSIGQTDGELGISILASTNDMYFPLISQTKKMKSVYCSYEKYIAVDYDNIVWGCGMNPTGSFGIGTTTAITTFTPIFTGCTGTPVIAMSPINVRSSYSDCVFIVDVASGNMYSAGTNSNGQLGLGNTTQQNTFTLVPKISSQNWAYVWQYQQITFAVTDSASGSKLYACGNNSNQSLGVAVNGGNVTTFTPCQYLTGTPVTGVKSVVCTSAQNDGIANTYILLNNGRVYVTGLNFSSNKIPGIRIWINSSITFFGFIGPIIENVTNMQLTGDNTRGCIFFSCKDGSLWSAAVTHSVLTAFTSASVSPSVLEHRWLNGERISISSILGNPANGATGLCVITTDGTAILGGTVNSNFNCMAGRVPLNSQLISRNQASVVYLDEPIVDARIVDTFEFSTVASNVILRTITGKIYICGKEFFGLGGRYQAKNTFYQLNI